MEQINKEVSYKEEKAIIKSLYREIWKENSTKLKRTDNHYSLMRMEKVIMFRLRTGHNGMNAHMFRKLKIGQS